MATTRIPDTACVRGALNSILNDANCSDQAQKTILAKIEDRTKGNNSAIYPGDIKDLLKDCFSKVESSTVQNEDELTNAINRIDNENTFGIFYMNGTEGQNQHVMRIIGKQDQQYKFIDSTNEKDLYTMNELKELSKAGFDLVMISK
jgi:hypothetical protein